jgi:hypothetical protein
MLSVINEVCLHISMHAPLDIVDDTPLLKQCNYV